MRTSTANVPANATDHLALGELNDFWFAVLVISYVRACRIAGHPARIPPVRFETKV